MNEPDNLKIIKRIQCYLAEQNINALLELVAEDAVWIIPGPEAYPPMGKYCSRDQIRALYDVLPCMIEFGEHVPTDYIPYGDKVVVLGYETGYYKPSKRSFQSNWVEVFTLNEQGLIVKFHKYLDRC